MGVLMAPVACACGPCTARVSRPGSFGRFTGVLLMDGAAGLALRSHHLERGSPVKPVPTSDVHRILFVRPRFLGDVCLTLPAVDAALAACPGATAAYVTEAPLAPLLAGDPRFAEVITVPAKPSLQQTVVLIRKLCASAPDVAFDFFCN